MRQDIAAEETQREDDHVQPSTQPYRNCPSTNPAPQFPELATNRLNFRYEICALVEMNHMVKLNCRFIDLEVCAFEFGGQKTGVAAWDTP